MRTYKIVGFGRLRLCILKQPVLPIKTANSTASVLSPRAPGSLLGCSTDLAIKGPSKDLQGFL